MPFAHSIRGERFTFADLRELLGRAGEPKSGDQLAGVGAESQRQRVAAQAALADVTLDQFLARPVIDPAIDDVSRLIFDDLDRVEFARRSSWTVGRLREWLLSDEADGATLRRAARGLTPEIAAAVAKLCGNKELAYVASKIRNPTRCRNTQGLPGVMGVRLQPNHPTDDPTGVLLSVLDGLLYGCGDAVIGVNPAAESPAAVEMLLRALDRAVSIAGAPTQTCVLAHLTTQLACLDRGAPVDLLFQSIAGTQAANASFGVTLSLLEEGRQRVLEQHARRDDVVWVGEQVMYFETGQGSALSADAAHGADQLTLEARAYGVARRFDPFLVNSVVGFIGPEYLADERQIVRAGLEDHFVGKLLGLPMGVDVCYTNHADADQNSADNLLLLLAAAGCNYIMGVPCGDDVMLNYQSTSFHDAALTRALFGLRPAPEFDAWLHEAGLFRDGRPATDERSSRRWLDSMTAALPARPAPRLGTANSATQHPGAGGASAGSRIDERRGDGE